MNRRQILEREQRWARVAGLAAIAIVPLYIASIYLEGQTSILDFDLETERFRAIDAGADQLLGSAATRALAFLLFVPPLLYLFRAAQARSERVSPAMLGFVFIGPVLAAIWSLVFTLAQNDVASDFVAASGQGGDIYLLLENLQEDSTFWNVGASLILPALLGLLVALIYVCLQAMRVGLLTRFFATLGMALGVALLLIVPQFSLLAISVWFGWLGFLILDRVPNGRPPAWAAGEAIPWPRPGEEPSEADAERSPAGGDASEDEVDAEELVSPSPKDQTARRERARKKKRKRRG